MLNEMLKVQNISRDEYLSYPNRAYMRKVILLGWLKATGRITDEKWLILALTAAHNLTSISSRITTAAVNQPNAANDAGS